MGRPHLFVAPDQFDGDIVRIAGPNHVHLARVLRARPGDPLLLLDDTGNAFRAVLVGIGKDETLARIVCTETLASEPCVFIVVAQALGKGDRFEQVIQHGVEVGAGAFVPVRADRSVGDLPSSRLAERLSRWRQIAKGAAEQSGRARIPEVRAPECLSALLAHPHGCSISLLLHPCDEAVPLHHVLETRLDPQRVLLAVGPEGGWSPAEVESASSVGAVVVSLGSRILRTETAALTAISQILYHYERT